MDERAGRAAVARRCAAALAFILIAGCESPLRPQTVVATTGSGPVRIAFVSSTPLPGSTVPGCGATPVGCQGRLSMTFMLQSNTSGHLRSGAIYLFDANSNEGCLGMRIPSLDLVAGVQRLVTVNVDITNQFCPMPLETDRMTFTIYDDAPLRSQQTFRIRYSFRP